MYTREEVKAIIDKIINMANADAVEVNLTGGERSGTRWANSSITVNLVQYRPERVGQRAIRPEDGLGEHARLQRRGTQGDGRRGGRGSQGRRDSPNLPELLGPQQYIPVDAALPNLVNFGPAERARMVKDSIDLSEKMGTVGAGYIPKNDQTNCIANSKGLFAYYRAAETGFVLTCRTPDGTGSGWAGITGIKDVTMIDAKKLTDVASNKALKSRKPKALEPGRYTVILEPRANARFLSLMTGIFGALEVAGRWRPGGGGGGVASVAEAVAAATSPTRSPATKCSAICSR